MGVNPLLPASPQLKPFEFEFTHSSRQRECPGHRSTREYRRGTLPVEIRDANIVGPRGRKNDTVLIFGEPASINQAPDIQQHFGNNFRTRNERCEQDGLLFFSVTWLNFSEDNLVNFTQLISARRKQTSKLDIVIPGKGDNSTLFEISLISLTSESNLVGSAYIDGNSVLDEIFPDDDWPGDSGGSIVFTASFVGVELSVLGDITETSMVTGGGM